MANIEQFVNRTNIKHLQYMKRIIIFMLGMLGFSLASCVEMYGCPTPVQRPSTEEDKSEEEENSTEGEEDSSAEAAFEN